MVASKWTLEWTLRIVLLNSWNLGTIAMYTRGLLRMKLFGDSLKLLTMEQLQNNSLFFQKRYRYSVEIPRKVTEFVVVVDYCVYRSPMITNITIIISHQELKLRNSFLNIAKLSTLFSIDPDLS